MCGGDSVDREMLAEARIRAKIAVSPQHVFLVLRHLWGGCPGACGGGG
jgi:hypothetical protein